MLLLALVRRLTIRPNALALRAASSASGEVEIRAQPAPGAPFHHAFPVHSIAEAKAFYGGVLGCEEGRSSEKWQDYSLFGHQIVAHWAGDDYRCVDYYNPVDGDEVPVPPTKRFEGAPGEQWTMFFKDPSGNNLEFKAMAKRENLFAKYNVEEG
jgi:extradiol dioxygenase family protein